MQIEEGICPVILFLEIEKKNMPSGGTGSDPWSRLERKSRYFKFFHGRCPTLVKKLYERFKLYNESFPTSKNHFEILPLIWFLERSKESIFFAVCKKCGISVMLEDDNCNWTMFGKILVAKVKELSDRRGLFDISRYSRFLSLKNIFDSTLPLKLLKETHSSLRLTNLEIDNGRGPCSLLLLNQRATNELCRNSPICPVSWLLQLLYKHKSCSND